MHPRLDDVLVATRSDLRGIPAAVLPPEHTVREMEPADATEIERWLAVHNDAFGHTWGPDEFRHAVLEHRHIEVLATFVVEAGSGPVAVASVGRFRRNPSVGVGHYIGVARAAQSGGLGKQLAAHRYAWLRDAGFRACESQTHISRVPSIRMHFDLGFQPKYRLDPWNNPDTWSRPVRLLTEARMWWLHRRWWRDRRRRS